MRRPIQMAAWLTLVLAGLSLLAWRMAVQVPPSALEVQSVQCTLKAANGTEVLEPSLTPPYRQALPEIGQGNMLSCRFSVPMAADALQGKALYVPSFIDKLLIAVNGERIAQSELYLMRNLHLETTPAFVSLPQDVLREGDNEFLLSVSASRGRHVRLDRIYVGEASVLRSYFHARWFITAVLPTLVVGGQIAFGIIFFVLWAARPRDREFGWLAVALVLGVLRGSVLIPDFGLDLSDRPLWNIAVLWEVAAVLMFCRAVSGCREGPWSWAWALPALLLTLFFFAGRPAVIREPFITASVIAVLSYMALSLWVLGRAALRGNQSALIVLLGMTMLTFFAGRDIAYILGPEPDGVFLTRAVYSGFLVAVASLMTLRFVRAMRELDNTAVTLRERVAQTQAELSKTYEELRLRRETAAVNRERVRIMRDLHDGLGGELASMLALADAPEPRQREIALHARAALADMRLIISSLEDYGGDLTLALGSWRERAEPQLRAAGLSLVWNISDVPSLAWLGPAQTLDVLRIVQEATTNVIKHARASQVTIATLETEEGVSLTICDDGVGGVPQAGGNGIGNMKARAARLNAVLRILSAPGGVCVQLVLPRRL